MCENLRNYSLRLKVYWRKMNNWWEILYMYSLEAKGFDLAQCTVVVVKSKSHVEGFTCREF